MKHLNIAVLGDCIIDDYRYGKVSRISPEFPVQILTSSQYSGKLYCGGAANVCYQMKHFDVDAFLIGFLDYPAKDLFRKQKFNIDHCVKISGRVPKKVRFYDGDFPLLRWDIEEPNYGGRDLTAYRQQALENFKSLLASKQIDVVILSDYAKGFWSDSLAQEVIGCCKDIITIVDPKKDMMRWKGCTIFKPNTTEARSWCDKSWEEQCDFFQKELGCKGVVITQEGRGVVGKHENHFQHSANLNPKEVNSVIGAGDCFNAVLAMALGNKFSLKTSCRYAFEGGVQYVKARHNCPITPFDIKKGLDPIQAKIIALDDLIRIKNGKQEKFIFTNGCFDLLGLHHLELLRYAKSLGDKLIVAINDDGSIRKLKGNDRPVVPLEERMTLLASLEYVDYVLSFNSDTPYNLIEKIQPYKICKGGDYKPEDVVGVDVVGVNNISIFPYKKGFSTTERINNIK